MCWSPVAKDRPIAGNGKQVLCQWPAPPWDCHLHGIVMLSYHSLSCTKHFITKHRGGKRGSVHFFLPFLTSSPPLSSTWNKRNMNWGGDLRTEKENGKEGCLNWKAMWNSCRMSWRGSRFTCGKLTARRHGLSRNSPNRTKDSWTSSAGWVAAAWHGTGRHSATWGTGKAPCPAINNLAGKWEEKIPL